MILLKSREFAAYAGLDIHIRTTRVDNARVGYSYISGAAVKLGFDVLEVMEDGELILNGNAVFSPTTFADGSSNIGKISFLSSNLENSNIRQNF